MTERQATLFQRAKRDRWTLVVGILALAILGIAAATTIFGETLLSNLAWESQLKLEQGWTLLQAEVAPDESLWALVENENPFSAELQKLQDGEVVQAVQLADEPLLRTELESNEGHVGPVSSTAVDNAGRLWLNMGSSEVYSWDGERWTGTHAAIAGGSNVEELEYGAGIVWALLSSQSGLLAIDPISGESREYSLEFDFSDPSCIRKFFGPVAI